MKISIHRFLICGCWAVICGLAAGSACAADGVWTDPKDPTLPPDFQIQGEYVGQTQKGDKLGRR